MVQNLNENKLLLDYLQLYIMQFREKKLLLDLFKPDMMWFMEQGKLQILNTFWLPLQLFSTILPFLKIN